MWADAQRDGRPAEYRWRPLRKFPNFIPVRRGKLSLTPTARLPYSNAANIGERNSWTQSDVVKFRYGSRAPANVCVPVQRRPNIVQSLVDLR